MYSILNIGALPGTSSILPLAMNNSAQIVGVCNMSDGSTRGFVWDQTNGMFDLTPSGESNSYAAGINSAGLIAGETLLPQPVGYIESWGFIWKNDWIFWESSVPTTANDINDSGVAACTITLPGGNYSYAATQFAPLGPMSPLGQNSAANGINNSGQVVGTFQFTFPDGPIHAALWSPTGQVQDLGALPGGDFSEGMKINDAGTVIGVSTSSGASILRGFSWTPGQGMIDLNPDGLGFTPGGINQSGTIVGSLGANSNMAGIASIVTGAVIQDLNGLILPGYNVSLSNGCAINDSGQIVVTGTVDFVTGAFLLTPVVIQPRKQRPATCEPLLQKFIMWNADLTQRIQDLQNLGTPQREIPNDPTVKTLSNDIAKLSTEMTAVGCPPPLLVRVAPLADSNP